MNSFELNKILGALLGACLVLVAMHIAAGEIFTPEKPAKPGYEIAVKEEHPAGGAANAAPPAVPIETLLASASADRGADVAKQCQACHNFQQGAGPKIGPDLYNIIGRKIASAQGFNYSAALKSKNGNWDFQTLNTWLTKPNSFAPGTAMTFAGISNDKQRADVIAYLDTLSPNPVPLPKPQNADAAPSAAGPGSGQPAGAPGAPPAQSNGAAPGAAPVPTPGAAPGNH
jgi:cytochrome c